MRSSALDPGLSPLTYEETRERCCSGNGIESLHSRLFTGQLPTKLFSEFNELELTSVISSRLKIQPPELNLICSLNNYIYMVKQISECVCV